MDNKTKSAEAHPYFMDRSHLQQDLRKSYVDVYIDDDPIIL